MSSWGLELEVFSAMIVSVTKIRITRSESFSHHSFDDTIPLDPPIQVGPLREDEYTGILNLAQMIFDRLPPEVRFGIARPVGRIRSDPDFIQWMLYASKIAVQKPVPWTPPPTPGFPHSNPTHASIRYLPGVFHLSADHKNLTDAVTQKTIFQFMIPEFISAPYSESSRFAELGITPEMLLIPIEFIYANICESEHRAMTMADLGMQEVPFEIWQISTYFKNELNIRFYGEVQLHPVSDVIRTPRIQNLITQLFPAARANPSPSMYMQMTGAIDITHFGKVPEGKDTLCELIDVYSKNPLNVKTNITKEALGHARNLPSALFQALGGHAPSADLDALYRAGVLCLVRFAALYLSYSNIIALGSVFKTIWVLYLKTSLLHIVRAYLIPPPINPSNGDDDPFISIRAYVNFISNRNVLNMLVYGLPISDRDKQNLFTKIKTYLTRMHQEEIPIQPGPSGIITLRGFILSILLASIDFPVGSDALIEELRQKLSLTREQYENYRLIGLKCFDPYYETISIDAAPGRGRPKIELRVADVNLEESIMQVGLLWDRLGRSAWDTIGAPIPGDPDMVPYVPYNAKVGEIPSPHPLPGAFPRLGPIPPMPF